MKAFAKLLLDLEGTNKKTVKTSYLSEYFLNAIPEDAAWAVYLLSGHNVGRVVSSRVMREWLAEFCSLPVWLIEESYHRVGDSSETISLILRNHGSETQQSKRTLSEVINKVLLPLRGQEREHLKVTLFSLWTTFSPNEVFVLSKILSGGFRVGVARKTVFRSLAVAFGLQESVIELRAAGQMEPTESFFSTLISPVSSDPGALPVLYPFYLAYSLDSSLEELGAVSDWTVEWKWDGIRAQVVKRNDSLTLWSRGEEIISGQFPELCTALQSLEENVVLDGEIVAWFDEGPSPFGLLQKRLGRKKPGMKTQKDFPVRFIAYDIIEYQLKDIREYPLKQRKNILRTLSLPENVSVSTVLSPGEWKEVDTYREEARSRGVEGVMLKPNESPYGIGRRKGGWLKWKVTPFTIDAVLIYAQRGSGQRAGLFSDFTFALWDSGKLVPIAKAYSGLTNDELQEITSFVRKNTKDTFGPVRSVEPQLVFELAFEGISRSSRHKSGFAVRFPRILRWRRDKTVEDIDHTEELERLLSVVAS